MSEWKPGDVAEIRCPMTTGAEKAFYQGQHSWLTESGLFVNDEGAGVKIRPLVVIDIEDAGQVERLRDAYIGTWSYGSPQIKAEVGADLAAALREFARPTPPKPDEPQGLGAVVEDDKGVWWVRVNVRTGTCEWRSCDAHGRFLQYADVPAVRILSPGVEATP